MILARRGGLGERAGHPRCLGPASTLSSLYGAFSTSMLRGDGPTMSRGDAMTSDAADVIDGGAGAFENCIGVTRSRAGVPPGFVSRAGVYVLLTLKSPFETLFRLRPSALNHPALGRAGRPDGPDDVAGTQRPERRSRRCTAIFRRRQPKTANLRD